MMTKKKVSTGKHLVVHDAKDCRLEIKCYSKACCTILLKLLLSDNVDNSFTASICNVCTFQW